MISSALTAVIVLLASSIPAVIAAPAFSNNSSACTATITTYISSTPTASTTNPFVTPDVIYPFRLKAQGSSPNGHPNRFNNYYASQGRGGSTLMSKSSKQATTYYLNGTNLIWMINDFRRGEGPYQDMLISVDQHTDGDWYPMGYGANLQDMYGPSSEFNGVYAGRYNGSSMSALIWNNDPLPGAVVANSPYWRVCNWAAEAPQLFAFSSFGKVADAGKLGPADRCQDVSLYFEYCPLKTGCEKGW